MKQLREGFTTGSCAAACALASCLWQRDGECPARVEIIVPDGRVYAPAILEREGGWCGVIKDSGDDPDITNGCEVRARVHLDKTDGAIRFAAGEGVGVITLPGLKLPVGEAAINPVPRQMIEQAVRGVYPTRGATVEVSIVGGRELAQRTFNPRLGIQGGLSVLGTSGIVRPMSEEALTETIRLELSMHRAQGLNAITLVFGAQGENAMLCLDSDAVCVQISNFVGFALDACAELGFSRVTLAGQPGKLVKVSGGSMQTHSKYGDGRKEPLVAQLAMMGAPLPLLNTVWQSVTLDGVIASVADAGFSEVWSRLCRTAAEYCEARTHGRLCVETLMLDGKGQIIGEYRREGGCA